MSSASFLQELALLAAEGTVPVEVIKRIHVLHNQELIQREADILILASGTSKKTDEQKEMTEGLLSIIRVLFSKCQINFPTVDGATIAHTPAKGKRVQILAKVFEDTGQSQVFAKTVEALLGKSE